MDQEKEEQNLEGLVIVITGGNSGIGKETARGLAKRGSKIILAGRNAETTQAAAQELQKDTTNPNIFAMKLDLASFQSIRLFAEELSKRENKIHVLINNAGIFYVPPSLTEDGYETVFQTNYLGHFLLALELLNLLKAGAPSRIINVTSHGHKMCKQINFEDLGSINNYSKFKAYSQSKLAQVFFTKSLARKLQSSGVTVNSVNPGNVKTNIYRTFPLVSNRFLSFIQWPFHYFIFKSPEEGAQTSIFCAVNAKLENETGKYYSNCAEAPASSTTQDTDMEQQLWVTSMEMIGKCDDDYFV